MAPTYHVELRDFPRACTQFNQSGAQVGAIAIPWVQDRVFEVAGEKWAPYASTITIIEGPPIPLGGISMGRGWRTAQREGTDVTERVLGEARGALADGSAVAQTGAETGPAQGAPGAAQAHGTPASAEPSPDYPSLAGSAGAEPRAPEAGAEDVPIELAALLGADAARLLAAWRRVASRTDGLAPSESLALAERELAREDRPRP